MRILILNQSYHPDPSATAQHAHDLGRMLAMQGHEVHVVASRSLYGAQGIAFPKEEMANGVAIHRVGWALFGKVGLCKRMADFALFHLLATWRMGRLPRQDVVIALTTPPFIALPGWLITRLRGGRLVSWVMDLYPHVAVAGGVLAPNGLPAHLLEAITRFTLKRSARVVVLGRCMQERLLSMGIPEAQLTLIGPWAAQDAQIPLASGQPLTVMYAGNLGLAHDICAFKQALLILKDDASIRFIFSGGGKQRADVEKFAQEHGLTHVSFLPYLPRERLAAQLAAADVHLVSQHPAFTGLIVPSKLYGVLALGRAVAAVAPQDTELARTVHEATCGEVFAPTEAGGQALAQWLCFLASNPAEVRRLGHAARQAHEEKHAPALRLNQWIQLLQTL